MRTRTWRGALVLWFLLSPAAHAMEHMDPYMPPEILNAYARGHKITVPKFVNVNTASLEELKCLPGVDENLGLRLMRLRPMRGVQDFYRLRHTPANQAERLMQRLKSRVEF